MKSKREQRRESAVGKTIHGVRVTRNDGEEGYVTRDLIPGRPFATADGRVYVMDEKGTIRRARQ